MIGGGAFKHVAGAGHNTNYAPSKEELDAGADAQKGAQTLDVVTQGAGGSGSQITDKNSNYNLDLKSSKK